MLFPTTLNDFVSVNFVTPLFSVDNTNSRFAPLICGTWKVHGMSTCSPSGTVMVFRPEAYEVSPDLSDTRMVMFRILKLIIVENEHAAHRCPRFQRGEIAAHQRRNAKVIVIFIEQRHRIHAVLQILLWQVYFP